MNGSLIYDANTKMQVGKKFTGTRSDEQCKGYAKNVYKMLFGIVVNSTQPWDKGLNYKLYEKEGMEIVKSYPQLTESYAKDLFSGAHPGDFVQMRRMHGGSHSAIVYSVSATGVTFLEANADGKMTVQKNTYTWAQLNRNNQAMTVYTATDYKIKE